MRSEIMMNFVQVCSIDQMSILSRIFALPILTVFTFSTPVGSVWTVISGPRSCQIECSLHFGLMDRTPFVSLSIRLWLRRSWIGDPRSGARAFFRMRIVALLLRFCRWCQCPGCSRSSESLRCCSLPATSFPQGSLSPSAEPSGCCRSHTMRCIRRKHFHRCKTARHKSMQREDMMQITAVCTLNLVSFLESCVSH